MLALITGCGGDGGVDRRDVEVLRSFDRHQLLWLGERFEKWELEHVDLVNRPYALLIYGTCEASGDGGCAPPLQLQIQPLCAHLGAVARAPEWKSRRVRGAPVGTIDGAPVLFTGSVQVKVYRGRGTDAGVELRALEALRSANSVAPVIEPGEPIDGPPVELLERGRC